MVNDLPEINVNRNPMMDFFYNKLGNYNLLLILIMEFFLAVLACSPWVYSGTPEVTYLQDRFGWLLRVMLLLILYFINRLYKLIPKSFNIVYDNNVLKLKGESNDIELKDKYREFIKLFDNKLNSKREYLLMIIGIPLICYYVQFPNFVQNTHWCNFPISRVLFVVVLLFGIFYLILLLSLVWKLYITTISIKHLCSDFDFEVQLFHSDKCGGLKPLGEINLSLSPVILSLGAIIMLTLPFYSHPHGLVKTYIAFVVYILISISFTLYPIHQIHKKMKEYKMNLFKNMKSLYINIENLCTKINDEQITELKKYEYVYEKINNLPVWPINIGILSTYIPSIALPIMVALNILRLIS